MIVNTSRGSWLTDMSADEMEEAKRRQAERDYTVTPRPAPKRSSATRWTNKELELLRDQLLQVLKS
jgi:hypothetical protein